MVRRRTQKRDPWLVEAEDTFHELRAVCDELIRHQTMPLTLETVLIALAAGYAENCQAACANQDQDWETFEETIIRLEKHLRESLLSARAHRIAKEKT